jgi:glyoxylase-like metal-dependent hydrolase (beta-lactamase superfamily II)
MPNYLCRTCGTQFPATDTPPVHCPICEDERQYIGWAGQQWTTLETLRQEHHNNIQAEEPNLTSIITSPAFAIGQRALLVQTPVGNVLWDCISLVDDETVQTLRNIGGIRAIAISHPHFYSGMVEWSRAFGGVPIYLHADDQAHVCRPDPSIVFWQGETCALDSELTLIRCGGHFAGATVLHWASGAKGRGALLSGDVINVVSDRRYVSFMRSYPNLIPLPSAAVRRIVSAINPFHFDRIYGGWPGRQVQSDARQSVLHSAERYIQAITDAGSPDN